MPDELSKFFGNGPYPFPPGKSNEVMDIYLSEKLLVLMPKADIDFLTEGSHGHSSYEFLIPYSLMPPAKVDNKKLTFEVNRLFPLNSCQEHGPSSPQTGCRFLTFQVDASFLREISRSVYKREDITFHNGNYSFDKNILELIYQFITEWTNRQAGYRFILDSLSTLIVINLFRQIKNNMPSSENRRYIEKDNINRAIDFLMEYYNNDYSLESVAKVANLSPYHFIRVFKTHTGKTPYEYLLDIKTDKAREMLVSNNRNLTITQISYLCGFSNLNHFSSVFKRKVGVSPSSYRKAILG